MVTGYEQQASAVGSELINTKWTTNVNLLNCFAKDLFSSKIWSSESAKHSINGGRHCSVDPFASTLL